jgi:hypothetical protein
MTKHSVPAVFALLGFCLSLNAQQADRGTPANATSALSLDRADIFNGVDGSALIHSLAMPMPLQQSHYLASTQLSRMGMAPLDVVPLAYLTDGETAKVNASARYQTSAPARMTESRVDPVYTGGEIGVLYGRSSGKYGGDEFQSYIFGTVGNEHFQISAGAAYEESSIRIPRFGR